MAAIWLQGRQTSMVTVVSSVAQGMTPRAEILDNAATTRMVATNVNAVTSDAWKVVGFRTLSPEAHAAVVGRAEDQGLSVSGYLRRVVATDLRSSGGKRGWVALSAGGRSPRPGLP